MSIPSEIHEERVEIEQRDMNVAKRELMKALRRAKKESEDDFEAGHASADQALLDYINDTEVNKLWRKIKKHYA
jgi:hypothetical protein